MQSNEELLRTLLEKVSGQMIDSLKDAIITTVEREITENLSKALLESEFYKRVNDELQNGLKDIYQEIKSAKGGEGPMIEADEDPDALFHKASDQLDAVLKTTEKAAVEIIEIVEKLQEMQSTLGTIVKGFDTGGVTRKDREKLAEINKTLGDDLSRIMVTLSFQDLTGQRIKIIIEAIRKVEKIVRDVFVTTGLMIKSREKDPDMDFEMLEQQAKSQVIELTGPRLDPKQGDVDDLLSQLGL
jgi:chemotaxis protein CheZ